MTHNEPTPAPLPHLFIPWQRVGFGAFSDPGVHPGATLGTTAGMLRK